MIISFKKHRLTGKWVCGRCHAEAVLQIVPMRENSLACDCGGPLVFEPDFKPVDDESAKQLFSAMQMAINGTGK